LPDGSPVFLKSRLRLYSVSAIRAEINHELPRWARGLWKTFAAVPALSKFGVCGGESRAAILRSAAARRPGIEQTDESRCFLRVR
jgi:hypothetical protein